MIRSPAGLLDRAKIERLINQRGSQMKDYHDREQRLIFKTCPGCRADLEQDAEECLFCDHRFQEDEVAESEFVPLDEPEGKSNRFLAMVALNVMIGLVGTALTSWERKRETPTYRHPPRMSISVKDRELFTRFIKEHGKSMPAELKGPMDPEARTRRRKLISVTFSNHSRRKVPFTKGLFVEPESDLSEKFHFSHRKQ